MIRDFDRRRFLRGGKAPPLRPPWAKPENTFLELCTGCGNCINHCPQQILEAGRLNCPQVNFLKGECSFCGECVNRCDTKALEMISGQAPWYRKACFAESCLNILGVLCRVCGEHCEKRAISFRPSKGGYPQPALAEAVCNGCGACFSACPVQAIGIIEQGGVD